MSVQNPQPTTKSFDAGDNPATRKSLRTADHGRTPTFQRMPVSPGRQNVAFTARGFIPDYMSEHGATMMPEASRTLLENEGVYGESGMMPPAGIMGKIQPGSKGTDNGTAGGAGSFASVNTFKARQGG